VTFQGCPECRKKREGERAKNGSHLLGPYIAIGLPPGSEERGGRGTARKIKYRAAFKVETKERGEKGAVVPLSKGSFYPRPGNRKKFLKRQYNSIGKGRDRKSGGETRICIRRRRYITISAERLDNNV